MKHGDDEESNDEMLLLMRLRGDEDETCWVEVDFKLEGKTEAS